jgi:citrate lyase beta subunit
MPGDDLKKIQKGISLGVDSIIMDLEDGVAFNRKAEARTTIGTALSDFNFGRSERLVRINPIGSGFQQADLDAVLPYHPDGIVIPKVERADQVQWVSKQITDENTRLLVLIESAHAIVNLREIAAADPRVDALIFGSEDFASDIGATRTREGVEISFARQSVVIHAAAFGLQAIDTLVTDFNDEARLIEDCKLGAQLGFVGKLAIHPKQVNAIQAAYTPSDAEIDRARKLIEAHDQHQASGSGAFALDGQMIDMPIVRMAEQVLAKARAAGKIS